MEEKSKYKYEVVDAETKTIKKTGPFEATFSVEEIHNSLKELNRKFLEVTSTLNISEIKAKGYRKANKRLSDLIDKLDIVKVQDFVDSLANIIVLRQDKEKIQGMVRQLEAELEQVELQTGIKTKKEDVKEENNK